MMAKKYDFNIIYNNAKSPYSNTPDTELSLEFTEHLVSKLEKWGYKNGYYSDRDAIPGRNIFNELFHVIDGSTWTIVVITPGFNKDCWQVFRHQSAFKTLLDKKANQGFIPISLNVKDEDLPREICMENVLFFTDEWNGGCKNAWTKFKRVFDEKVQVCEVNEIPTSESVEESADNLLRTSAGLHMTHPTENQARSSTQMNTDQVVEEPHKKVLRQSYDTLMSDLDTDTVLDKMTSRELLPDNVIRDIRGMVRRSDKIRCIVDKIMERGRDAYETFKECLSEAKQENLVNALEYHENENAEFIPVSDDYQGENEQENVDETDAGLQISSFSGGQPQDAEVSPEITNPDTLHNFTTVPEVKPNPALDVMTHQQQQQNQQQYETEFQQGVQSIPATPATVNINANFNSSVPTGTMIFEDGPSVSMPSNTPEIRPMPDDLIELSHQQTQFATSGDAVEEPNQERSTTTSVTPAQGGEATAKVDLIVPSYQQTQFANRVGAVEEPDQKRSTATPVTLAQGGDATAEMAEAVDRQQILQQQQSLSRDADISFDNASMVLGTSLTLSLNSDSGYSTKSTSSSMSEDVKLPSRDVGAKNQTNDKKLHPETVHSAPSNIQVKSSVETTSPLNESDQTAFNLNIFPPANSAEAKPEGDVRGELQQDDGKTTLVSMFAAVWNGFFKSEFAYN